MHILIREIKYLINSDDLGGFLKLFTGVYICNVFLVQEEHYMPGYNFFFFFLVRAFKGVRMENYKFRYRGIGM